MKITYQDLNNILFEIINFDEELDISSSSSVEEVMEELEKHGDKVYKMMA